MVRKVKRSELDSRTSRAKLTQRGKPYYEPVSLGLHLGYRRNKTTGQWLARLRQDGEKDYSFVPLGAADDKEEADGSAFLNYEQAKEAARYALLASKEIAQNRLAEADTPVSISDAVTAYVAKRDDRERRRKGKPIRSDASRRLHRYVIGQVARGKQQAVAPAPLAAVFLPALKETDLRSWRNGLPANLKATTTRRLVNDLKAALNDAFKANRGTLDPKIHSAIKFGLEAPDDGDETAPVARANQILSDMEVSALVKAAKEIDAQGKWEGDLFRMVLVLAATGARFSQVARLSVGDCQLEQMRLLMPASRKGKKSNPAPVTVPIGDDVAAALRQAMNRPADRPLLERWRHRQVGPIEWERTERGAWSDSAELVRPWKDVRQLAKLPDVVPYALRHSSIVRGLRANLPIRLVAALHDTSVAMIERHYAKWITSGLEDMARRAVVKLA